MPQKNRQQKNSFTDPRDGKVYRTVKIGEQVWMAENLAYNAKGSKCYDNDESNGEKYGRLYDWDTAMKSCPPGWHLPSNEEWQTLVDFVGGIRIAGKKLKAKNGWNQNGNGTNDFGFSALPGGFGGPGDFFKYIGSKSFWWSSTKYGGFNNDDVYNRCMNDYLRSVRTYHDDKYFLTSIRCVQDYAETRQNTAPKKARRAK